LKRPAKRTEAKTETAAAPPATAPVEDAAAKPTVKRVRKAAAKTDGKTPGGNGGA